MARKKDHSEEKIVEACIDFIAKAGKENFSVRNVASHMGSSTQPIYSYFKDSNHLYQKMLEEVGMLLLSAVNHPYSEFPFRNMGYGFILFARDNPNLFDAYFSNLDMNKRFIDEFLRQMRELMNKDQRLVQLSDKGKDRLLESMWIFCYGYAYLIIRGLGGDTSDEAIKERILDAGTAAINYTFQQEEL